VGFATHHQRRTGETFCAPSAAHRYFTVIDSLKDSAILLSYFYDFFHDAAEREAKKCGKLKRNLHAKTVGHETRQQPAAHAENGKAKKVSNNQELLPKNSLPMYICVRNLPRELQ